MTSEEDLEEESLGVATVFKPDFTVYTFLITQGFQKYSTENLSIINSQTKVDVKTPITDDIKEEESLVSRMTDRKLPSIAQLDSRYLT